MAKRKSALAGSRGAGRKTVSASPSRTASRSNPTGTRTKTAKTKPASPRAAAQPARSATARAASTRSSKNGAPNRVLSAKAVERSPRRSAPALRPAAKREERPAVAEAAAAAEKDESQAPAPAPARAVPNGIGLVNHHLDYTSHDMEGVRRFYTGLLGFSDSELDPQANYLRVRTGTSSSLGFMPPISGPPEQWRPPREPALYFMVEDVDRAHQELSGKGVTFDHPPTDMPWGHRLAQLRDPEGRRVCLAQIIGPRG